MSAKPWKVMFTCIFPWWSWFPCLNKLEWQIIGRIPLVAVLFFAKLVFKHVLCMFCQDDFCKTHEFGFLSILNTNKKLIFRLYKFYFYYWLWYLLLNVLTETHNFNVHTDIILCEHVYNTLVGNRYKTHQLKPNIDKVHYCVENGSDNNYYYPFQRGDRLYT